VRAAHKDDDKITSMAWDKTGARMIFGSESGAAGILTLP
jgi:hypothetical protein